MAEVIPLTAVLLTRARARLWEPRFKRVTSDNLKGRGPGWETEPDEYDALHSNDPDDGDAA